MPTALPISRRSFFALDFRAPAGAPNQWLRVHRRAMACRFELTFAEEDTRHVDAARAALDEADRVEALLTVFRQSSELSRINREAADGAVVADAELFALLERCAALHAETAGAFDITSMPLSRCWGFLHRDGRMPSASEIDAARALVGMTHVSLDAARSSVRFTLRGVQINLGAIGKGYAVDRMGELLGARYVQHALISAGGSSVLALGAPSTASGHGHGKGWPVDIFSPALNDADAAGSHVPRRLARVYLHDAALGTSGVGEQFIIAGGVRFGHVIDPRSGWPARGLVSATVITANATEADALSTAFLIGGEELALKYCESRPGTMALLMPDEGPLRVVGAFPGVHVET
jgi:FAD:protein FMN transferase